MAGQMNIQVGITADEVERKLNEVKRQLAGTAQTATDQTDKIGSSLRKLGAVVGVSFGVAQLKNFTSQLINVRGEFQKIEMAFQTMLGNKAEADKLMAQVVDTAAKTPFDLQGVANGAKQLLAYGVEAKDVNETLVRLGDIAAGLGQPLGRLTYLYGSTKTQGRLYSQDLMQFTNAGIPMVGELAKQFGVAESEVKKLVSEGKVGFEEVQKVIENLTNEGGKFGGLMEKQSQTLSGQIANLEDGISQMFNNIGKATEDILSGGIRVVSSLVENYQKVGGVLLALIATYGTYKTAVIVANTITRLQAFGVASLTAAEKIHYVWLVIQEKAQKALNATMLKNPYILAATAIAALVAGIVVWCKNTDKQNAATKETIRQQEELQKSCEKENEMVSSMIPIIQSKTTTIEQQTEAYKKLIEQVKALKGYSMEELKNMSNDEIESIVNQAQTQQKKDLRANRISELENEIKKLEQENKELSKFNSGYAGAAAANNLNYNKIKIKEYAADLAKLKAEQAEIEKQEYLASLTNEQKIQQYQKWIELHEIAIEKRQTANVLAGKDKNEGIGSLQSRVAELRSLIASEERAIAAKEKKQKDIDAENEKKYSDDRLKSLRDATNAELELRKKNTQDLIEQINIDEQMKLSALRQAKDAYIAEQKERGIDTPDTSGFDRQMAVVRKEARNDRQKVRDDYTQQYQDLGNNADKFYIEQEIELYKNALTYTDDLNSKLEIQQKIRQTTLQLTLDELEIERDKALEAAGNNKTKRDLVNKTYDQKVEQAKSGSEQSGQIDDYATKLQAYQDYAEKVLQIEQEKAARIKEINDSKELTESEKAAETKNTEDYYNLLMDGSALDILGDDAATVSEEMTNIVTSIVSQSLETVKAQIPFLHKDLQRLKKAGADPKAIAKANLALKTSYNVVEDSQKKLGETGTESNEKLKNKLKDSAKALEMVRDAANIVTETFGDMMSEGGGDALQTISTITTTAIGLITTVNLTALTSAESIKTVEGASVILVIIGAVIQVISAIVNVMMKYFSKHAQIQAQIDASKERVENLKDSYNDLERSVKKAIGTDYYQGQIELCKNLTLQQEEYNEQLRLANEQMENASNSKKKQDEAAENQKQAKEDLNKAKDDYDEAMKTFYDDLIGTDLKGFSENLAESIVDGFKNGLSDMQSIWDTAFDDMMSDMLKKQIAMTLEKNLASVFNRIKDSFGDGDQRLTEAEMEQIRAEYEFAKATSQQQMEEYQRIFNEFGLTDDPEQQAEKQGFAAMSQDTGDELNGRFTAIQISTANIDMGVEELKRINTSMLAATQGVAFNIESLSNIADLQLMSLREIADNTAALKETNLRLRKIEENTSKL